MSDLTWDGIPPWNTLTHRQQDEYTYQNVKANKSGWRENIDCDRCGKTICKAYGNDLNGSMFYCIDCIPL